MHAAASPGPLFRRYPMTWAIPNANSGNWLPQSSACSDLASHLSNANSGLANQNNYRFFWRLAGVLPVYMLVDCQSNQGIEVQRPAPIMRVSWVETMFLHFYHVGREGSCIYWLPTTSSSGSISIDSFTHLSIHPSIPPSTFLQCLLQPGYL